MNKENLCLLIIFLGTLQLFNTCYTAFVFPTLFGNENCCLSYDNRVYSCPETKYCCDFEYCCHQDDDLYHDKESLEVGIWLRTFIYLIFLGIMLSILRFPSSSTNRLFGSTFVV